MKLTYLFLFAFSILFLGLFSVELLQTPTGGVVSSIYTDYVSITALPDHGLPEGSGSLTLDLPKKVKSCTFVGSWVTDNDQFHRRNTCHNAQGTFSGYADVHKQYVVNDPNLYSWAGQSQGKLNPSAQRYEDASFSMELCDDEYYRSNHVPRYGVQGRIEGFGTETLSFTWDYKDDSNARPQVLFMIDLTCILFS
ncbi:hypothetical protein J4208_03065 [Candidatus Woesearchaeota archaeon]|nr:hypothetical protein [Candidatus Woesearchaeota archaeon]